MFKENKKGMAENTSGGNGSNRIVAETKFKGEVVSKSDFRIDGELEGEIQTAGRLVIGRNGVIRGKVICENADVEGRVEGNILVKNVLTLKSTAYIEGDVEVGKLSIEPGAIFNVACKMGQGKSSPSVKADEIKTK
ncbi:MAG: polymer-forming cytoskeletal protein [Capnocytophaga sp.]|nr:polymer-forming cytoskeletal protein [Capnocytophaga sp.]